MKKIYKVILMTILIPWRVAQAVNNYPGFSATIITNVTDGLPDNVFLSFNYPGGVDNMPGGGDGGLANIEKVDAFYPNPPTPNVHTIQIDIMTEVGVSQSKLCSLQYDVLTGTPTWLMNTVYKPSPDYPGITCQLYSYPTHIFLFINEVKT